MKLLIDNNISYRVSSSMNKSIEGCKHVSDYKMDKSIEDSAIWNFAKTNGFTILTKDNDFEVMSRLFGCPPKVIQLICGNKKTSELINILEKNLEGSNCLMQMMKIAFCICNSRK